MSLFYKNIIQKTTKNFYPLLSDTIRHRCDMLDVIGRPDKALQRYAFSIRSINSYYQLYKNLLDSHTEKNNLGQLDYSRRILSLPDKDSGGRYINFSDLFKPNNIIRYNKQINKNTREYKTNCITCIAIDIDDFNKHNDELNQLKIEFINRIPPNFIVTNPQKSGSVQLLFVLDKVVYDSYDYKFFNPETNKKENKKSALNLIRDKLAMIFNADTQFKMHTFKNVFSYEIAENTIYNDERVYNFYDLLEEVEHFERTIYKNYVFKTYNLFEYEEPEKTDKTEKLKQKNNEKITINNTQKNNEKIKKQPPEIDKDKEDKAQHSRNVKLFDELRTLFVPQRLRQLVSGGLSLDDAREQLILECQKTEFYLNSTEEKSKKNATVRSVVKYYINKFDNAKNNIINYDLLNEKRFKYKNNKKFILAKIMVKYSDDTHKLSKELIKRISDRLGGASVRAIRYLAKEILTEYINSNKPFEDFYKNECKVIANHLKEFLQLRKERKLTLESVKTFLEYKEYRYITAKDIINIAKFNCIKVEKYDYNELLKIMCVFVISNDDNVQNKNNVKLVVKPPS